MIANTNDLMARLRGLLPTGTAGVLPAAVRERAFARFAELGVPTTKHEDWRYTNLAPLNKVAFAAATGADVTAKDIAPYRLAGGAEVLLVFVDGRFEGRLSDVSAAPAGMRVLALSQADAATRAALLERLATCADAEQEALTALNAALAVDAAVVWVPRGAVVEAPVHVLHVATTGATPTIATPRTLIVADENSQGVVIEQYVSLGTGERWTNAVTELVAADSAVMRHAKIVREHESTTHTGLLAIVQGRATQVQSHALTLGAALTRNSVFTTLNGEGGDCHLEGLYMLNGAQHADNFLRVDHAAPHCDSREVFRGVLDGRSHGAFCGRIIVRPGAQKTDAKQTNKNLLLSNEAQADSKPQLEIYADDVKCTHGATIGQLDDDALFYLQARGIARETARSLLVYAFAVETLASLPVPALRAQLTEVLLRRLPEGELLRGAL